LDAANCILSHAYNMDYTLDSTRLESNQIGLFTLNS